MKFTKRDKRTDLEKKIDDQLDYLMHCAQSPEDIQTVMELIERRQNLKKTKQKISPDTIAIIAGNLLGIALILSYEKLNVITSKALGFVLRGRV